MKNGGRTRRWVAVDADDAIAGLVMLEPLVGWSAHVGSLRVVTDPQRRHRGIGRALAMHALRAAVEAELAKVVVEVVAEQEGAVKMFTDPGFRPEAVLGDHVRDHAGTLRDLLVLAHVVDNEWATMASVGIARRASPGQRRDRFPGKVDAFGYRRREGPRRASGPLGVSRRNRTIFVNGEAVCGVSDHSRMDQTPTTITVPLP